MQTPKEEYVMSSFCNYPNKNKQNKRHEIWVESGFRHKISAQEGFDTVEVSAADKVCQVFCCS